MSPIILLHSSAAVLALALGPLIFLRRKGDGLHRLAGKVFSAALVIVCISGFGIYELTGRPTVFHALAALSLWTIVMGLRMAWQRNLARHLLYMAYAYAGLIAALGSRLGVLLPDWPPLLAQAVGIATPLLVTEIIVRVAERRSPWTMQPTLPNDTSNPS